MKNKHFQELTEIFDLNDKQSDMPVRLNREVTELTRLHETLLKEEDSSRDKSRNVFLITGSILGIIALAVPFASILPFSSLSGILLGTGAAALVYGSATIMRNLNRDSAGVLKNRMDSVYVRMLKDMKRSDTYKIRQLRRRDKVIGGVAAELANRMDVPAGFVRFGLIALASVSFGFVIPLYLIAAMVLHHSRDRDPK